MGGTLIASRKALGLGCADAQAQGSNGGQDHRLHRNSPSNHRARCPALMAFNMDVVHRIIMLRRSIGSMRGAGKCRRFVCRARSRLFRQKPRSMEIPAHRRLWVHSLCPYRGLLVEISHCAITAEQFRSIRPADGGACERALELKWCGRCLRATNVVASRDSPPRAPEARWARESQSP